MSATVDYFATAQDLLDCARLAEQGRATLLGYGRAHHRRVAFCAGSRFPVLAAEPTTVVWGAAYRVPCDALGLSDRICRALTIRTWEGDEIACVAELTDDRPVDEVALDPAVAERLVEHARGIKAFPVGFRAFLADAAAESEPLAETALVAVKIRDSSSLPYHGLARISPDDASRLGVAGSAALVYRGRSCPVDVEVTDECKVGTCQLNQHVRGAVGIQGRHSYGQRVSLHPLDGRRRRWSVARPRPLSLPVSRPNMLDSEKNLVVLHERNIALLGLEPGAYVRLSAAVPAGDGTRYALRHTSLRAFSGVSDTSRVGNDAIPYPAVDKVYLDAYGRRTLGLDHESQHTVLAITADVPRLFVSRSVYYAGTLLLSLAASRPLTDALGTMWAICIAVAVTLAVTVFDLRSRVQY